MANLSFIIGIIGNVIAIMMFASPMGTFRRIVRMKSTEEYGGLPYVTTLSCTSLWILYGLLKPNGLLLVTVNGVGATLQLIFVTLFLIYAPKDTKVKMVKLIAILNIGFVGAVIAVALPAFHGETRLTFVGIFCAALTIGMYAAPLSIMRTVITTKSVEYMPFSVSFFQFATGGVWSIYSVLIKDFYLGVAGATGFFLGSVQLILYIIYMNKSKSTTLLEVMKEEGSAQLAEGSIEMKNIDKTDETGEKDIENGSTKDHS